MNENINPNEFSQSELLKHVYREMIAVKENTSALNTKIEVFMGNVGEKIESVRKEYDPKFVYLEKELTKLNTMYDVRVEENDKFMKKLQESSKWWMAGIGLLISVVSFIINMILK